MFLVAQGGCGCPIPGGAPGQAGWGPGQPELEDGVPAHSRGWNRVDFRVPSNLSHSVIPCFFFPYELQQVPMEKTTRTEAGDTLRITSASAVFRSLILQCSAQNVSLLFISRLRFRTFTCKWDYKCNH